ncbi:MAG: hypothetical protein ABI867_11250 [Kofleriaceae bacterium]
MKTIPVILMLAFALTACGKKSDEADDPKAAETKRMAGLCATASELSKSKKLSGETFREVVGNRLSACSAACDGDDQPSCTQLEEQITKLCSVSPGACEAMCDPSKPGSLTRMSCPRVKK